MGSRYLVVMDTNEKTDVEGVLPIIPATQAPSCCVHRTPARKYRIEAILLAGKMLTECLFSLYVVFTTHV